MSDATTEMLELEGRLAEREAAGHELSPDERAIRDILWINIMVCPNGFDGWRCSTPGERMLGTVRALETIGDGHLLAIIQRVLQLGGGDIASISDEEREARLDSLNEQDYERLGELDREYYECADRSMTICQTFVNAHPEVFGAA